ncbi:MAG TPA: MDR family oxidoreductase [Aliidongia sp.]|nr:MDR family oxidoreductase [Aliidongia sp.]
MSDFRALLLTEEGGKLASVITTRRIEELPPGDVLVRIQWSTLNYKDGMVLNGLGRLVRTYPHIPGVDFSGTVEESSSPAWRKGDQVILTGWRVGEQRWGGYAQYARVPAEWLVRVPDGMTAKRAMAIGTAGFTSMLAVMALERHGLKPGDGKVLVTGAAGGVGSVAIAVLAHLGYEVAASTGRAETHGFLKALGAADCIDRATLAAPGGKPLQPERWAGAIDAVGGTTLANLISQLKYRASVAACGLAGGSDYPATVIPFLLRGVNLLGIDSVLSPIEERREAWGRLAAELPVDLIDGLIETIPLAALPEFGKKILEGQVRGRIVVEIDG